jgi:hypothetical protein
VKKIFSEKSALFTLLSSSFDEGLNLHIDSDLTCQSSLTSNDRDCSKNEKLKEDIATKRTIERSHLTTTDNNNNLEKMDLPTENSRKFLRDLRDKLHKCVSQIILGHVGVNSLLLVLEEFIYTLFSFVSSHICLLLLCSRFQTPILTQIICVDLY